MSAASSIPPACPTAANWRWSPVSSSFAPAAVTWRWMAARSVVLAIADSSTTTRSPGLSRQARSPPDGFPSVRRSWVPSQRAMLRACSPSPVRTSVAIWLDARPDHLVLFAVPQVRVLPGVREHADDEGLAGTGRADQGLDIGAGGEHAADRGGLVLTELDTVGAESVEEPSDAGLVEGGCVVVSGGVGEQPFGVDVLRGGIQPRARCVVCRAAVVQSQLIRQHMFGRAVGIQRDGQGEALGGELVEQRRDLGAVAEAEEVGQRIVDRPGQVGRVSMPTCGSARRPARSRSPHCGDHCAGRGSLSARARTSAASWARPPSISARSSRSTRSRRCSVVSPWWDFARRVAKVAWRCSRSRSSAVRLAAELRLERGDEFGGLRGDRAAPRGVQLVDRRGDPDDLAGLAVRAHRDQHPQRRGQPLGGGAFGDRPGRGPVGVEGAAVQGAPHPVCAEHPVGDGVVDVQLRVVVARVVLEERGDGPLVRVGVAAGGAAVVPDPGVAGVLLEVVEAGVVAGPDRVLHRLAVLAPRLRRPPRRRP